MGEPVRLQKLLAQAGFGSRRSCETFIVEGRVTVDGAVVRQLGSRADPETQVVEFDGEKVAGPGKRSKSIRDAEEKVYYALNKPRGVLCTNEDPSGRPLAVQLVPEKRRIYCVGRLDIDTEGLIILTNDGELTNQLTHPRYGVDKTYIAKVDGRVTLVQVKKLEAGVHLAEGKTQGAKIRVRRAGENASTVEMTISEGMNRQVRRMLARVELRCRVLRRVAIGPVRIEDMPVGASRRLTTEEISRLKAAIAFAKREATAAGHDTSEDNRSKAEEEDWDDEPENIKPKWSPPKSKAPLKDDDEIEADDESEVTAAKTAAELVDGDELDGDDELEDADETATEKEPAKTAAAAKSDADDDEEEDSEEALEATLPVLTETKDRGAAADEEEVIEKDLAAASEEEEESDEDEVDGNTKLEVDEDDDEEDEAEIDGIELADDDDEEEEESEAGEEAAEKSAAPKGNRRDREHLNQVHDRGPNKAPALSDTEERPRSASRGYEKRERPAYGDRRDSRGKPERSGGYGGSRGGAGQSRGRGDRPYSSGAPRGDRPYSSGAPRGDRPYSSGRPSGERSYSSGKPRGDRPYSSGAPRGDRPYSAGKSSGSRPYSPGRPSGDRPYSSGAPRGDRPYSAGRPSGGRPYSPSAPRRDMRDNRGREGQDDRGARNPWERDNRERRPSAGGFKKPWQDRSARPDRGDRPSRPYSGGGDRPSRPYSGGGDRPSRPYSGGGDRPSRPYAAGGDRPSRPYSGGGDRPSRPYSGGGDRRPSSGYQGNRGNDRGDSRPQSRGPGRPWEDRSNRGASRGGSFQRPDRGGGERAPRQDRPYQSGKPSYAARGGSSDRPQRPWENRERREPRGDRPTGGGSGGGERTFNKGPRGIRPARESRESAPKTRPWEE